MSGHKPSSNKRKGMSPSAGLPQTDRHGARTKVRFCNRAAIRDRRSWERIPRPAFPFLEGAQAAGDFSPLGLGLSPQPVPGSFRTTLNNRRGRRRHCSSGPRVEFSSKSGLGLLSGSRLRGRPDHPPAVSSPSKTGASPGRLTSARGWGCRAVRGRSPGR